MSGTAEVLDSTASREAGKEEQPIATGSTSTPTSSSAAAPARTNRVPGATSMTTIQPTIRPKTPTPPLPLPPASSTPQPREFAAFQNGPANLLPALRVFRHLKRIRARNLVLPNRDGVLDPSSAPILFNCSFSLLGGTPPKEIYSSERLSDTMNPDWCSLSPQRLFGESVYFHPLRSCQSFLLKVYHWPTRTSKQVLLESTIDLTKLSFLGNLDNIALPPNTLIFELHDGLYAERSVLQRLQPSNRFLDIRSLADMFPQLQELPPVSVDEAEGSAYETEGLGGGGGSGPSGRAPLQKSVSMTGKRLVVLLESYSTGQLREVLRLYSEMHQSLGKTKELARSVGERVTEQRPMLEKQRQRDLLKRRVREERQEELRRLRETLARERAGLERLRKEVLPRAKLLNQAQITLLANKTQLAEQKVQLEREHQLFLVRGDTLNIRRRMLISQLRTIFPITQLPDRTLAIGGFALPNSDFTGYDEEFVATALGYVCHALYMIAKWLQLPLRYTMIPMCSRSFIRDDISQEASPKFPLYSRGMDRPRFEYAVFLLNKNLEQLMAYQGLDMVTLRHTLQNLQRLFQIADEPSAKPIVASPVQQS